MTYPIQITKKKMNKSEKSLREKMSDIPWASICAIGMNHKREKRHRKEKKDLKKYWLKLFKLHLKHLSPVPKR